MQVFRKNSSLAGRSDADFTYMHSSHCIFMGFCADSRSVMGFCADSRSVMGFRADSRSFMGFRADSRSVMGFCADSRSVDPAPVSRKPEQTITPPDISRPKTVVLIITTARKAVAINVIRIVVTTLFVLW